MAIATTPQLIVGTREDMPTLADFKNAIHETNPFAVNRISEPSSYDVDVTAIHAAGFDRLVTLSSQVVRQGTGVGVALLGAAGVGKSHLLSRLYRWANTPTESGDPRACYVYLHNILADPDRLPRYLLKYVISRLAEGGQGALYESPLYRFIDRAIRHALEASGITVARVEDHLRDAVRAYRAYFRKAAPNLVPFDVLFQFWRFARPEKADEPGRRAAALTALAWLSGDEIDPTLAAWIGFRPDASMPILLRDDQEIEHVLLALTQLARVSGQPFILCIDQVENLDPDEMKPLARFLHALLDHARNLLIITSSVKQTLLSYKDNHIIPEAAWDRIAQYKVDLQRVSRSDGRRILEARLEQFMSPYLDIDEIRRRVHEDTLYPLGSDWMERQFGDAIDLRPRDVLTWARDAWDELPDHGRPIVKGPMDLDQRIDALIDRKIAEFVARRKLEPGSLPPDAGNLTGLVETLLRQCVGSGLPYTVRTVERLIRRKGKLPPYDLLVRERRDSDHVEVTTGILFVTTIGAPATRALKRLLEDPSPPHHRVLVTDQQRGPLKVGKQGVAYYKSLESLGPGRFEHIKLNLELYALLDALSDVVRLARSGDLEIDAEPGRLRAVTEAEVIASHHRRDRYRNHPLLRPLLTEEPAASPAPVPANSHALDENDVRQYIRGQLAWMIGSTTRALTKGYLEVMTGNKPDPDKAWPEVKRIAERMHAEGQVHATPQDDDLLLLLKK